MTEVRTPKVVRVKAGTYTNPEVFKKPEEIAKESPEAKEIAKLKEKNKALNRTISQLELMLDEHKDTIRYWEDKFKVAEGITV